MVNFRDFSFSPFEVLDIMELISALNDVECTLVFRNAIKRGQKQMASKLQPFKWYFHLINSQISLNMRWYPALIKTIK